MVIFQEKQKLTNENIAALVEKTVNAYEKAAGKRATSTLKLSLSIEEILLNFQDCYGADSTCSVTVSKSMGKVELVFRKRGNQINPIPTDTDDIGQNILASIGAAPKYSYDSRHNANVVSFLAELKPQKNKTIYQILIAIALAVICYFGISLLPAETGELIADSFVAPFFNKLTAVISAIATPLVFFAVVNGIADIGDVSALGQIGKKFMTEIGITYLIAGLAFTGLAVVGYGVSATDAASGGSYIKQIVQLVLDIIPNNLLTPFSTDNDLQVVVVAIFIGIALILMQKKSESIKNALVVVGDAVNQMMTIALKLIPAIVFLGVLNILCKSMTGLKSLYIMFIMFIASAAIVTGYVVIRALILTKAPFKVLFSKQLATTMINLTTSSQVSALPENMICCKKKFGIDPKLVDFGLPLGIVINMPNGACFLGLIVWALAGLAGIEISIFNAIVIMIMAIIVAIAAPPIPGSVFTVMPILMSICSVPNDYYPVAIIAGTILGYFLPLLNGYCLQLQLLIVAKKLDMVDLETLRKPMGQK